MAKSQRSDQTNSKEGDEIAIEQLRKECEKFVNCVLVPYRNGHLYIRFAEVENEDISVLYDDDQPHWSVDSTIYVKYVTADDASVTLTGDWYSKVGVRTFRSEIVHGPIELKPNTLHRLFVRTDKKLSHMVPGVNDPKKFSLVFVDDSGRSWELHQDPLWATQHDTHEIVPRSQVQSSVIIEPRTSEFVGPAQFQLDIVERRANSFPFEDGYFPKGTILARCQLTNLGSESRNPSQLLSLGLGYRLPEGRVEHLRTHVKFLVNNREEVVEPGETIKVLLAVNYDDDMRVEYIPHTVGDANIVVTHPFSTIATIIS